MPSLRIHNSPPIRKMMRRAECAGHARFLTFSCYKRLPLLDHDGIRTLFLKQLQEVCADQNVRLLAWVLMPEHVHLIVFPESTPDVRRFTHALKQPLAQAVIRRWKDLQAPILRRIAHGIGHRYWQRGGGYDRNLFEPEKIWQAIDYIHHNPVRRGLCNSALDYAWSSARWYAGMDNAKIPCGPLPW